MMLYFLFELQNWPTIAQLVHDILKSYPRLRLTHGRKVPPYIYFFSAICFFVKYITNSCSDAFVAFSINKLQVLEVRPVIDWDKGKAVEFLLESLGTFASLTSLCFSLFWQKGDMNNLNFSDINFLIIQK